MNRTTMMFLMLGLAAPLTAMAAPAATPERPAVSTRELDASVRRAISGYEPLNAPRELRALATEHGATAVTDSLLRLLRDSATPGILRLSAVEALGYAPAEAGRTYLHELVAQLDKPGVADDDRSYTLAAAVRALGSFSSSELVRIATHLHHGSPDVREAAATALVRCGAPAAEVTSLLQKRLAVEAERGVKETLRHSLESMRAGRTNP